MKDAIDIPISTNASVTDLENARDHSSGEKPNDANIHLVEWDGPDDPELPMNFPFWRKSLITCIFSTLTIWVTFSSSVFSAATTVTSKEFHVSKEVMTLGTSLTVLVSKKQTTRNEGSATTLTVIYRALQWDH